jgi:hypothetical protein
LTQSLTGQEVYAIILPMGLWILINQLTDRRDWKSRVLRIRDVLDPNFFHPGSRIQGQKDSRIGIFSTPDPGSSLKKIPGSGSACASKNWSSRKYDAGRSSRMRILDPDLDFLPIPDPGEKGTGYRIRNTGRVGNGSWFCGSEGTAAASIFDSFGFYSQSAISSFTNYSFLKKLLGENIHF